MIAKVLRPLRVLVISSHYIWSWCTERRHMPVYERLNLLLNSASQREEMKDSRMGLTSDQLMGTWWKQVLDATLRYLLGVDIQNVSISHVHLVTTINGCSLHRFLMNEPSSSVSAMPPVGVHNLDNRTLLSYWSCIFHVRPIKTIADVSINRELLPLYL